MAAIAPLETHSATLPAPEFQVADLVVAYLEQIGVTHLFGVPGGAIEPLYNAIARSQRRGGMRPVVARHESGAAFMADAYARETGRIGVCCATSGPGATNLITGVACAFENAIPMLVITGQPPLPSFGKRALQESTCTGLNTLGMFRHCTRYDSLISHPDQLESKLVTALQRAVRTPCGPVHLTIPLDILKMPSPVATPSYRITDKLLPPALIDIDALAHFATLLAAARNPRLLIGGNCANAVSAILAFAHKQNIPFVTTPDGKGLINPGDSLFHGVFGFAGHHSALRLLQDDSIDLVIAIGSSMNEWNSSGWSQFLLNNKLIHIDESAEHLARSPMAQLHLRGNLKAIFHHLQNLPVSQNLTQKPFLDNRWQPPLFTADLQTGQSLLHPGLLMQALGRLFPPHTRYLADAGNSVAWAIHYLHPDFSQNSDTGNRAPELRWLSLTMDFAPMGWAIGGAIGSALADPSSPVVCITGDGSMLMNGQEISVAVAEKLPVIFIVLNDSALGMVKHGQRLAGAERIAFELPATDFARMAEAMGAQSHTIYSLADLQAIDVDQLCNRHGPTLLDVRIDPEAVPPIALRMQMLNGEL